MRETQGPQENGWGSPSLGTTVGHTREGWCTCSRMNSEAATRVGPLGRNQAERSWNSWSAPVWRVGAEPDIPWSLKS